MVVTCTGQDVLGDLLLCTQNGVYEYAGRQFSNLGPPQGLPSGEFVLSIAVNPQGDVAVAYPNQLRISEEPESASRPLSDVFFQSVALDNHKLASGPHPLILWHDQFVVLADGLPMRIDRRDPSNPRLAELAYSKADRDRLRGASGLFVAHDTMWTSNPNGTICQADPGATRCFGPPDGLAGGPWYDVVGGKNNSVLARSATSVATIDTRTGTVEITDLPDQGGALYSNYLPRLGLFLTPTNTYATQGDHGIVVLGHDGWHALDAANGVPSGIITGMFTDRSGQFWMQVFGRGLYRCLGFGHWNTIRSGDGLTEGLVWETARDHTGRLWVTTDTGLMTVASVDGHLRATKMMPGSTFAVAVDHGGRVWSSSGSTGLQVFDPMTGTSIHIDTPPVNAIHPIGPDAMWVATEKGVYRVDDTPSGPSVAVHVSKIGGSVLDLISDDDGGVFYIDNGRLRHLHRDGTDVAVGGPWLGDTFSAIAFAHAPDGTFWIGGSRLYRFRVASDTVNDLVQIDPSPDGTSAVNDIFVDHRGWIWLGTGRGLLAFNGRRWSAITTNDGLIWNDISQCGISEDPDGSLWISTSAGLANLRNPGWIFNKAPVENVITTMTLGGHAMPANHLIPYTTDPLLVQFGTQDFGAEQSIVFRYHLTGVDTGWTDTTSGLVHYPFIPFGTHHLFVFAYDTETHMASRVSDFVIRMQAPWWRRWWAETGYVLIVALAMFCGYRLMRHVFIARQHQLERLVEERTREMRQAQIALERLAITDGLTGLFNRKEAERFIRTSLETATAGRDLSMLVALIDIDHFKQVNDCYGHLAGDSVLRTVAEVGSDIVQAGEIACRNGGEEFLVVLHDEDGRAARRIAYFHERVQSTVTTHEGRAIGVTCSIGVTRAVPGDTWETLIGRADGALYRAKTSGRNRIVERAFSAPTELRVVSG